MENNIVQIDLAYLKQFSHLEFNVSPNASGGFVWAAKAHSPDRKSTSLQEGVAPTSHLAFVEIRDWLQTFESELKDPRFDPAQWND